MNPAPQEQGNAKAAINKQILEIKKKIQLSGILHSHFLRYLIKYLNER